jgi:enoyl-CoA hydratase/carnithine racemase
LDTEIETHRRDFSTLYTEVAGRIGHLVLNRPASLNAINDGMLADLTEAVRWIDSHRELRVVIFKGNGRGFCAGADLNSLPFAEGRPATGNSWLYRREAGQVGTRLIEAIEQMHAVTIAQVHGCAVGGGVLFMIACDLTRELIITCRRFTPEEARDWRWINRVTSLASWRRAP